MWSLSQVEFELQEQHFMLFGQNLEMLQSLQRINKSMLRYIYRELLERSKLVSKASKAQSEWHCLPIWLIYVYPCQLE